MMTNKLHGDGTWEFRVMPPFAHIARLYLKLVSRPHEH